MAQDWRQWLETPAGSFLLHWEQSQIDDLVADIFGYHAIQLGMPELNGLRANRMSHQWLALSETNVLPEGQDFHFAAHSI